MKKLLSVLFAVAFAMSVSGFALAADNTAAPKKAETTEKAEKKAPKKAAKKAEKTEKAPAAAPAPAPEKK